MMSNKFCLLLILALAIVVVLLVTALEHATDYDIYQAPVEGTCNISALGDSLVLIQCAISNDGLGKLFE